MRIFNKSLVEKYQIENLYDAVREGLWTFDLFGQYAALVIRNGFINQTFVDNTRDISSQSKVISRMMEQNLQKLIEDYSDSQE